MSTVSAPSNSSGTHELHPLRNQWWCFLLLGIALVVLGSFCIIDPLVPSLASVVCSRLLADGRGHHANRQHILGRQMERHVDSHADRRALRRRWLHDR